MKTYKITAVYTSYCVTEIEAENEDEAFNIAQDLDGGAFDPIENEGDFRIYDIQQIEG